MKPKLSTYEHYCNYIINWFTEVIDKMSRPISKLCSRQKPYELPPPHPTFPPLEYYLNTPYVEPPPYTEPSNVNITNDIMDKVERREAKYDDFKRCLRMNICPLCGGEITSETVPQLGYCSYLVKVCKTPRCPLRVAAS